MGAARIIDSHIHCGVQHSDLPFTEIAPLLREAGITDCCLFAPVEDIYDRDDFHFQDNTHWQQARRAASPGLGTSLPRHLRGLAGTLLRLRLGRWFDVGGLQHRLARRKRWRERR